MSFFKKIFGQNDTKWFQVFEKIETAKEKVAINQAVTVLIEDKKICLARTKSGWYAVADVCPHLGASLSKGKCNNFDEIVCPWHNYRFDLKLGHETSGQGTGLGIGIYKVEERNTGLYIGL
ncbi:MAG: Rieske 2Fe-2S domain-containing protein [Bacteroidota bacterium]|nr:Rieske 2Fe-2S domain-containing protein [Bacteroidota bacterium]